MGSVLLGPTEVYDFVEIRISDNRIFRYSDFELSIIMALNGIISIVLLEPIELNFMVMCHKTILMLRLFY